MTHSIGKIGDSESVFDEYDAKKFIELLKNIDLQNINCVGTHCWPGILDLAELMKIVDRVIVVTTATHRSKLYRWVRAYHHYYKKSEPWLAVSGNERIDKERETAKNYLKPFLPVYSKNIINLEFAEIVDNTAQFFNLIKNHDTINHIKRWQEINNFLYDKDLWNSVATCRLYEAELETQLNQHYVYDKI